jgi:hypothetical protein
MLKSGRKEDNIHFRIVEVGTQSSRPQSTLIWVACHRRSLLEFCAIGKISITCAAEIARCMYQKFDSTIFLRARPQTVRIKHLILPQLSQRALSVNEYIPLLLVEALQP